MQFEPLIGAWHGEGEIPMEPPMKLSVEAKIERLGKFIVFSSAGEPADVPASVSIIGGAPGEDWNGPDGPGFDQRFIGEISADRNRIKGRWERGVGKVGDKWELDFPIDYERKMRG